MTHRHQNWEEFGRGCLAMITKIVVYDLLTHQLRTPPGDVTRRRRLLTVDDFKICLFVSSSPGGLFPPPLPGFSEEYMETCSV